MNKLKVILAVACFSALFSIQAFAGWVQTENGHWNYDLEGTLVINQWIEDQGDWYYLNNEGIMLADITQEINGVSYTFDNSGKCMNPNASDANTTRTFINNDIGFTIDIPTNVTTDAFDTTQQNITIESEGFYINMGFYNVDSDLNPWAYATNAETELCEEYKNTLVHIKSSYGKLGDYYMYNRVYLYDKSALFDFYSYVEDHKVISIVLLSYSKTGKEIAWDILSSLKKLS
jgi:hypothetical protein